MLMDGHAVVGTVHGSGVTVAAEHRGADVLGSPGDGALFGGLSSDR